MCGGGEVSQSRVGIGGYFNHRVNVDKQSGLPCKAMVVGS